MNMSFGDKKHPWTVYEGVKVISIAPEALMAEINSAITTLEYARATAGLQPPPPIPKMTNNIGKSTSEYDARMANEAYKTGLASMVTGKLDEAVLSLQTALSKCPPDQTSAVAKLHSLISPTSDHLQKPPS